MKIEPVKNKKRGAYLEYYYYSDWHLFLWSKWLYRSFDHDFYIFFRQNELQINFGWRQNSLFLRSAGSVLKMSLILSSLQEAHRQRTEKLPTYNSQLEAARFSAHSILCFENAQRQIAALNTVRTFFVFVKSSWSANNRNELQVTKLAW